MRTLSFLSFLDLNVINQTLKTLKNPPLVARLGQSELETLEIPTHTKTDLEIFDISDFLRSVDILYLLFFRLCKDICGLVLNLGKNLVDVAGREPIVILFV